MKKLYWWPVLLTIAIVVVDQITKLAIVANLTRIEEGGPVIRVLGDFFRIIHTRNLGALFGMGNTLPPLARRLLLAVLPLILVVGLLIYYLRTDELSRLQRWAVAAIVGGGIGNIIDRLFRPEGVVDFMDFAFFGIFGWERFPTWNVADAGITVGTFVLLVTLLFFAPKAEGQSDGGGDGG